MNISSSLIYKNHFILSTHSRQLRTSSRANVEASCRARRDVAARRASAAGAATGTNAAPHIKLVESGDTREFNIYNDGSGNGHLVLADSDDDTSDTEIVLADNGNIQFKTANSERMTIDASGIIISSPTYAQTTSNSANMVVRSSGDFERSTSSRRYKNTITDATKGLEELKALRPVNYKGNNDGETVFYGLIAEEVHDAGFTEFVEYNDENEPDALKYPHMVALCIKAIQEQQTLIETLTTRIETLEGGE